MSLKRPTKTSTFALNSNLIKVTPAVTHEYNNKRTLLLRKQTLRYGNSSKTLEEQNGLILRIAIKLELYLQSRFWYTFIIAVTIFVLFGDDLRIALFPKSADVLFDILSILSVLVFIFEILATSFVNRTGYLGSFYFYLDLLAILSMVTDVTVFWNQVVYGVQQETTSTPEQIENFQNTLQGSRSSKIIRIVRIVRLVRVAKLFGLTQKQNDEDYQVVKTKPSKVGIKLADKTMKRVIAIVLLMLLSAPFFETDFYEATIEYPDLVSELDSLSRAAQDFNVSNEIFFAQIQAYVRSSNSLLHLSICPPSSGCMRYNTETGGAPNLSLDEAIPNFWDNSQLIEVAKSTLYFNQALQAWLTMDQESSYFPSLTLQKYQDQSQLEADFRFVELGIIYSAECYGPDHIIISQGYLGRPCTVLAYFDKREGAASEAWLNILRTIFIALVLLFGYILHKLDADELVITPIERMVASLQNFAANPMANIDFSNNQNKTKDNTQDEDETVLLQDALTRVGRLLQISFGAAGSRIIAKNMLQAAKGQEIDPMIDGQRMTAVFGFCDIRNFTDTTECLQEKVMVYVNRVGQIVHNATHMFGGAANKNIGDAFLLVWRVEETAPQLQQRSICDSALLAFIKVMIDLKRENEPNGVLHSYTKHPAIKQRFGDNFKIKLGIGLHIGWAIEGAIGSQHKIDASYLSPNVNLAARLEAATKQFGSSILLSSEFYNMLSYGGKRMCRLIDKVTVKGSLRPMGIYTLDITNYPKYFPRHGNNSSDQTLCRINFESDEVKALQRDLQEDFLGVFQSGLKAYLDGNWQTANNHIEQALRYYPEDGPAKKLQGFMSLHNFQAPAEWKGVRELTEK